MGKCALIIKVGYTYFPLGPVLFVFLVLVALMINESINDGVLDFIHMQSP
jgi:hypothetical protein